MASGAGQVDDDGCCCCLHASYSCVILIKSWDVCKGAIYAYMSPFSALLRRCSLLLFCCFSSDISTMHTNTMLCRVQIFTQGMKQHLNIKETAAVQWTHCQRERCVYYLDAHLYRRCTAARWYCTVHTQPTSQGQCTKESKMLFSDSSVRSYDFPSRTPGRGRAVVRCSTRFAPYFQGANSSSVWRNDRTRHCVMNRRAGRH